MDKLLQKQLASSAQDETTCRLCVLEIATLQEKNCGFEEEFKAVSSLPWALTRITKVGQVASGLQTPEGSQPHLVFHASLVGKKIIKKEALMQWSQLIALSDTGTIKLYPETVLARKISKRKNGDMGLIKWTSQPKEDATWEQLSEVVLQFPEINFYRHGFGEGKGNVAIRFTSLLQLTNKSGHI